MSDHPDTHGPSDLSAPPTLPAPPTWADKAVYILLWCLTVIGILFATTPIRYGYRAYERHYFTREWLFHNEKNLIGLMLIVLAVNLFLTTCLQALVLHAATPRHRRWVRFSAYPLLAWLALGACFWISGVTSQ